MLPDRIDRFLVEGVAGKGGMGTVYRARDERSGEPVALKVVTHAAPYAKARFAREAEALTRVSHPGVVRFIAQGTTPAGEPYLVMQWIDGEDLATHLRRGPLETATALELARGVANALAALHAQGLVHRDLKPHNILLANRDPTRPVLVDLGIARRLDATTALTMTGHILGTPQYMAPEQIEASYQADHRADLFALGCVLFESLAARPLFLGDNAMAVLAKIMVERPPPLAELGIAVPRSAEDLLGALLEKNPQDRPAAALDVAARLATCLDALAQRDLGTGEVAGARVVTVREHRAIAVAMATGIAAGEELLETATPEQAAREDDRLRHTLGEFGGQLWNLGSGRILVTFVGAGEATDLAAQAARCALVLSTIHPGASLALAVGSAQVDRVPVGDVINRVARLLERARAGHVRVDAASASLLDVRFRIEAREPDFELAGELDTAEPPRTLLGRQTRCVGRERELTTLLGALDEVTTEHVARAVVVTAPAGTGKSRLRHEFMQRVQRLATPATVLVARAEALRADSPLDLLAGLIRAGTSIESGDLPAEMRTKLVQAVHKRISADADRIDVAEFLGEIVGAGFPNESSPRLATARDDTRLMGAHMSRAFLSWVDAESKVRPIVFVLEDLHWGDHQTVRFLDAALRDLADRPILVLALARPELDQRFPQLWQARGISELHLGALSARAAQQLVRDVLGDVDAKLVDQIVRRADGNAFYLEELVRAASDGDLADTPLSVIAMVQARLEALDARLRRVLRAASVFGETFGRGGTSALVGTATLDEIQAAFDELVEREVVVARGDAYAFRHALVREAAYAMLTDSDRQVAHGLAAEWLETHGETDALLLAQHYNRAHDMVGAARSFARAARQALEKNDFDAAIDRATRAIDLGGTGRVLAEAHAVRGKAFAGLGRWGDAEAELDRALDATSADAVEDRMEVLREMYFVATFRQSASHLRKAGTEVMALANRIGRPELILEANSALAVADHADERCDEALERLRETPLSRGERASPVVGLAGILLYHVGMHAEAETLCTHMLALARDVDDDSTVVLLYANLGLSLAALGRYADARVCFADSRAIARQRGLATLDVRAVSMSAGHHVDLYDYDAAAAIAREAAELGRKLEFPTPRISSMIDLAFIAVRTGKPDEAATILDAITPTVDKGTGFHGWLWRERAGIVRGELDLARGDFASALRRADASIVTCAQHHRLKYEGAAHAVRARALAGLGKRDDAMHGLVRFLDDAGPAAEPAIRLRASTTLLSLGPDERARAIALDAAAVMEAGLPRDERGGFRARVDPLL